MVRIYAGFSARVQSVQKENVGRFPFVREIFRMFSKERRRRAAYYENGFISIPYRSHPDIGGAMITIQKVMTGSLALLFSSMVFAQTTVDSSGMVGAEAMGSSAVSKSSVRAANRQFALKVQRAIYHDQALGEADIIVFANAGTGKVVLVGLINEPTQEQTAIAAAKQVAGVTGVTSKLSLHEAGN
jgi:hyperosmotically inducible periplasmic protein